MHATPSNFFERILRIEALVCKSYFFSEQPFYGNYSTLDSHTITVISHAFAYSSRWRRKPWQGLLWYLIRSSTRTCMQWHAGTELRLSLGFEFIVIVIWKNGNCNLFTCKTLKRSYELVKTCAFQIELEFGLKCWFLRRGGNRSTRSKTSGRKRENQQKINPNMVSTPRFEAGATLVGGECSHHCATLAPLRCLRAPVIFTNFEDFTFMKYPAQVSL